MEPEFTVGEVQGRNLLASAISKETGVAEDEVARHMRAADEDMLLDVFVDCMRKLHEKDGNDGR